MKDSFINKNKRIINYSFVLIYFLIHLFILSKHEMWRDEAQAWLLVKNTTPFHLFKLLRVEGHPFLWFFIIGLLEKMGLPFKYLGWFSLLLMTAIVYLFLKKSPFPLFVNVLIIFSSPFFYYNAVIARSYVFCVLLSIVICIYYKERFEKPLIYMFLIAMLLQTHIKISGLVIGFCLEFLYGVIKNKRNDLIKYLFLPILSFVFLILELIPYGSYRQASSVEVENFTYDTKAKILRGFTRIAKSSWGIENENIAYIVFALWFILLIIGIIIVAKKKAIREYIGFGLILCPSLGVYYIITAFVHGSHSQMATILSCIVLTLSWILYISENYINKRISIVLIILFSCMTIFVGFKDAQKDINSTYSYGKETSDYILENLSDDSIILMTYDYCNPVIVSYCESSKVRFYDANFRREYSIHQWNTDVDELEIEDVYEYAIGEFKNSNNVYYICRSNIDDKRFNLVYSNLDKESIQGENFAIYKINY